MMRQRSGRSQMALPVHPHDNRRNFQQSVSRGVESAGFDIDDDGQKTPETTG